MRTAPVLVAVVLFAGVACTYSIPDLVPRPDGAGGPGDDGDEASTADSGSDDGSVSTDGVGHVDAGNEGHAACGGGVLCPCNNAADCTTGICAASETVGSALYQAAGNGSFCTQPCCTSVDCSADTVCFASGQGGNYCVDPAWLGRSSTLGPASATGGTACTSNAQCRSGLCTGSMCADTCCSFQHSAAECSQATTECSFGSFPGATSLDTHFTAHCALPGGAGQAGQTCSSNEQCAGGLCYPNGPSSYCVQPCASSVECGAGYGCQLDFFDMKDMYFACFPWPGTGAEGSSCNGDMQCLGGWCNASSECTNVCFTDAACSADVPGWRCTPQEDDGFPSGNYLVLACGP